MAEAAEASDALVIFGITGDLARPCPAGNREDSGELLDVRVFKRFGAPQTSPGRTAP